MSYRIGIDIGGTFTDLQFLDEEAGTARAHKVPTTPGDPSEGLVNGIREAAQLFGFDPTRIGAIMHGTTIATNAVLERKLPVGALVTTRGFRDVLELRRHVRVTTYELWSDPPKPLVPRELRLPIDERTYSDGSILRSVRREEIQDAVQLMRAAGVEAIAVAFLHSYVNPENEREAGRLLAELAPEIAVTLSSDVLPQIKES